MRPISPKEIREIQKGQKVVICRPVADGVVRRPGYVYRMLHATRADIRYVDEEGSKVLLPWSLDTNKPINDPNSKLWLEHFDKRGDE